MNTAEILYCDPAQTVYKDPQQKAGKYSLAINEYYDRLSLTFKKSDFENLNFINLSLDLSSALPLSKSGNTCGVTKVVKKPTINIKLYHHNSDNFQASTPPSNPFYSANYEGSDAGTFLFTGNNQYITYNWKRINAPLNISSTTLDYLTITFESTSGSGYIALDNLLIAASMHALPIELIDFKLISINDKKALNWEVNNMVNFNRFEVEASRNGTTNSWKTLALIDYKESQSVYSFNIDKEQFSYYRLKLINNDESYYYSNTLTIPLTEIDNIKVYPTIVENNIHIRNLPLNATISILNMNRQNILNTIGDNTQLDIDVSSLPKGMYLLKINNTFIKKIVK